MACKFDERFQGQVEISGRVLSMIRVLLVPSSDYVGHPFPQRHNQIFERLNDRRDFEIHVVRFALFEKPKTETTLIVHELEGAKVNRVASYYLVNTLANVSQIRRIVKQEGIDVVVLSNLAAPFGYALLEELHSNHVPTVFDLPDYFPTGATGYVSNVRSISGRLITGALDTILHFLVKRATIVTAASTMLVDYARNAGAKTCIHVPNGIGECFLSLHDGTSLREKLGYAHDDLIIGYIGSLEFWLDLKSLIKGVGLAQRDGLSAKLLIVGKRLHSNYSENISGLIEQEKLQSHVKWLGFVPYDQVPAYMAALDIGTIPFDVYDPTAYYSAPNKLWEYFSQMRSVVATPIPEIMSNLDCAIPALTSKDYANSFLQIAAGGIDVKKRIETGYKKASLKTWKRSSELFASIIYSLAKNMPDITDRKIPSLASRM